MALSLAYVVTCDMFGCAKTFIHPTAYLHHNEATRAAVAAGWHRSGHNGAYTCPAHAGTPTRLMAELA